MPSDYLVDYSVARLDGGSRTCLASRCMRLIVFIEEAVELLTRVKHISWRAPCSSLGFKAVDYLQLQYSATRSASGGDFPCSHPLTALGRGMMFSKMPVPGQQ